MKPVIKWVEYVNNKYNLSPKNILDIGSNDDKYGNELRQLFWGSDYMGIDIQSGKNVDIIMDAYSIDINFVNGQFDAVLCLNFFEHVMKPWIILEKIAKILQKDGLFYVSIPTIGFPIHNCPYDYWRVTERAMRDVFMDGYKILSLEHDVSEFGKHPFINCLGRKV